MSEIPLIAIVDDDASLRSALDTLLSSAGYRSVTYESATAFLASNDAMSCHCVISDISMPGMTGFELKRRLLVIGCEVPVILITGRSEPEIPAQAAASGVYCLLTKPFEARKLIKCLANALAA